MAEDQVLSEDAYYVPAGTVEAEIKVKGSRFIAQIFPAETREMAEEIYNRVKKKYHNATHNCFAYRITRDEFRYSDDGEPSGTAGKPILQALDGRQLFEVLCVVTRYFGGTKLGTGGLIRAYSAATEAAVQKLKIKTKLRTLRYKIGLPYEQEAMFRRLMEKSGGKIITADYADGVEMETEIPVSQHRQFESQIEKISYLGIHLKEISEN